MYTGSSKGFTNNPSELTYKFKVFLYKKIISFTDEFKIKLKKIF